MGPLTLAKDGFLSPFGGECVAISQQKGIEPNCRTPTNEGFGYKVQLLSANRNKERQSWIG